MATLKIRKPYRRTSSATETAAVVSPPVRETVHPLDRVIGIFKDEPLMDTLMERVREDRRLECSAETPE